MSSIPLPHPSARSSGSIQADAHLRSVFAKLDLPDGPLENRRVHAVLVWRGDLGERADAG